MLLRLKTVKAGFAPNMYNIEREKTGDYRGRNAGSEKDFRLDSTCAAFKPRAWATLPTIETGTKRAPLSISEMWTLIQNQFLFRVIVSHE